MSELFSMDLKNMGIHAVFVDYGGVMADFISPSTIALSAQVSQVAPTEFESAMWESRADFDSGALQADDYWNSVLCACKSPVNTKDIRSLLFSLDTVGFSFVRPQMVRWIHEVHSMGIKTALVSNMARQTYENLVEHQSWTAWFDVLVISGILGVNKPDEAIYRHALQRCEVKPEEVLFIDDMRRNLDQAASLGMQTFLM